MPYSHFLKVIESRAGRQLITRSFIERGKIVRILKGNVVPHPTRTSIQIGTKQHIEDKFGRFINHSCSPTVSVCSFKKEPYIYAMRDIYKGDEITFDYTLNEAHISSPFICSTCGANIPYEKNCREIMYDLHNCNVTG